MDDEESERVAATVVGNDERFTDEIVGPTEKKRVVELKSRQTERVVQVDGPNPFHTNLTSPP